MKRPKKGRIFQRLERIRHITFLSSFENPNKYIFLLMLKMGWSHTGIDIHRRACLSCGSAKKSFFKKSTIMRLFEVI